MTIPEHLERIKAKCHELLAIAEKRTPGRWLLHDMREVIVKDERGTWLSVCDEGFPADLAQYKANAAFIASAAGPFEASMRSTIAAIDLILDCGYTGCETTHLILAAWPLDLL